MYALIEFKNKGIQLVKCFKDEPSEIDLIKLKHLDDVTWKQLKLLIENSELVINQFHSFKIEHLTEVENVNT